jgi:WD40 repeat protein
LASGGLDGGVRIWDPHTGQILRTLSGHTGLVQALASSADGTCLASTGMDRTVRIWNVDTGHCAMSIRTGHRLDSIILDDGRVIVAGGRGPYFFGS